MAGCAEQGLDDVLRERVAGERPVLGICLGLQLALEHSRGGRRRRGPRDPARPVGAAARGPRAADRLGARSSRGGDAYYFAHSYAAETPCGDRVSEGIVAEAAPGRFLGVQFHPEKSGAAGARYLDRQ